MRNALEIGDMIVTTDNAGGIGEKADDVVFVKDEITAKFAARVALLEQWSANAKPAAILIHNFSGEKSWQKYVQGVTDLFEEIGIDAPPISGSTEKNMMLTQSAIGVTIMGYKKEEETTENLRWFTYGAPLVGDEVIERAPEIASMKKIYHALRDGRINKVWPVGSRGILHEVQTVMNCINITVSSCHPITKPAGPSTVVLIGVEEEKVMDAKEFFRGSLQELIIG